MEVGLVELGFQKRAEERKCRKKLEQHMSPKTRLPMTYFLQMGPASYFS